MPMRSMTSTRTTHRKYFDEVADHMESPSSADHAAVVHPSVLQQHNAVSQDMPHSSGHSHFTIQDSHASRPHWGNHPQPRVHHAQRLYDLSTASERFYEPSSTPLAPLRPPPAPSSATSDASPSPTDRSHTVQPTESSAFVSLLRSNASLRSSRPPPLSSPVCSTTVATTKPRGRARTTPYLTETDRQDIMIRIRRGEKQADLAKEYHVSRAAITNLKQRRQMLEMIEMSQNAALGRALDATSPTPSSTSTPTKRRRLSYHMQAATTDAVRVDVGSDGHRHGHSRNHHEMATHTMTRLLSCLMDAGTSDEVFRATLQRAHRLLLEEAIGRSYSHTGSTAHTSHQPVALVSGRVEAPLLAQEYHVMEPLTPVSALCDVGQCVDGHHVDVSVRLPTAVLSCSPVVLFLDDIRSSTPTTPSTPTTLDSGRSSVKQEIARCLLVLQTLLLHGVDENRIFLVVAFCDAQLSAQLRRRFPDVHMVAARLLTGHEPEEERTLVARYHSRLAAFAHECGVLRVDTAVATPMTVAAIGRA